MIREDCWILGLRHLVLWSDRSKYNVLLCFPQTRQAHHINFIRAKLLSNGTHQERPTIDCLLIPIHLPVETVKVEQAHVVYKQQFVWPPLFPSTSKHIIEKCLKRRHVGQRGLKKCIEWRYVEWRWLCIIVGKTSAASIIRTTSFGWDAQMFRARHCLCDWSQGFPTPTISVPRL